MKNTKKRTVLIVEDETILRQTLIDNLISEGFNVLQEEDGETGLQLALQKHPDIILLDIILPKVDGLTMLKKLRKDKWGKTVLVVLLTNLSNSEKIAEAVKCHACGYLVKTDWKINEVIERIKELLSQLKD